MTKRDLTAETAPDTFDVAAEARRRGIQPYQVRASTAVNDKLMADIVADAYRGISPSASMIPDRERPEPVTKGSGWQEAAPLQGPDVRWVDAQLDAQDQKDRIAAIRRANEDAWVESLLQESSSRVQSEYDPFSAKNMKK